MRWSIMRVRPGSIRRHHARARNAGALMQSQVVNPDTRRAARDEIAQIGEFDLRARLDEYGQMMARGAYRPPS